ncbi:Dipeptidyl aminopeptidase/acylaminoacyl peptidase [Duganella sp. CF402]|uniref:S9 family peptidase n=1 Tax=unclassified Duganella TaxID=2636909 RepID=UPI0008B354E6|nr:MULTISPECIES: alpha/beta fold hydrolase [unclassified Duganella]RZT11298.1 dipeptidyl aminopeptidase/acylaminoacyl peptidase [Duganella sp. BK701]SEK71804.1 Dipeptidyl aminopeptidase/acylaminoacyl peptidase [Duganella sp. CF402]
MKPIIRRIVSGWLLFCVAAGARAQLPPVEDFFENSAFGGATLSPTGRQLAIRVGLKGQRDVLAVVELESRTAKVVAAYSDADIGNFQWVNESRLVYDLRDAIQAPGDQELGPGLYAVDKDGSRRLQLADRNWRRLSPQPWNTFLLSQAGSQDSDWIYVQRPLYDSSDDYVGTRLRRLNTVTGQAELVSEQDISASSFMLDFQGEPRLAYFRGDVDTRLLYLDPATGKWRQLLSYAHYSDARSAINPLGFGPGGNLFVSAYAGADTTTMRSLDLQTGAVSKEAIVESPGYDFDGSLIGSSKLLGVRLTTDAVTNVWFDPAMQAIQKAVDQVLPHTNNLISVPKKSEVPWVLVESYSDIQPSQFFLFDAKTGVLDRVGETYPKIRSAGMGQQEAVRYKARDGLEIPGLLTLPAGGGRKNLPMVVLVHGGPWVRGASWGWNPQAQFLASRGYAVLEVEFRGSTGFGLKHFEAGMKQWGLAMQDDIADGTRWAIAQGIADPRRICIAGASYGGYAALMGLVNDPELYRCAFEWLGVTDIELMYTGTWFSKSDASEAYLRYGMPLMIGDRDKDAKQLKATSPIRQAARIRQPLLLAYGSDDKRVPLYHGKKFYSAVTDTNQQVEWVVYDGEKHGWSLAKNRIDFWKRVERFLGKHIGQPSPK